MKRADAFFGALGRGYTVPVRDNGEDEDLRVACLAGGLELFGSETPDMVCDGPLPERPVPPGIVLHQVDDAGGRAQVRRGELGRLRHLRHAARGAP